MAALCIITVIIQIMLALGDDYKNSYQSKFPDIFYMDDYYECSKHPGNAYCTANMNLIPKNFKSKVWREIQDWSIPYHRYNHTVVHRTLCIPSEYKNYLTKKNFVESKTNKELKVYNLSAIMFSIDCMKDQSFGPDIRIIIICLSSYMGLILMATIYDQSCGIKEKHPSITTWLTCFSITSNWKKLTSEKNSDFQRLKCIQGIRTYQTILVIFCHTLLSVSQLNIKNTSFIEELYLNPLIPALSIFFMYIIQTYFVISSWLLTNQILELYKKNGRFSIRDGIVIFLHRLTRFWAPVLSMIFISVPLYARFANGPGNFEMANILIRTCKKNWWATFLQATNLFHNNEVCNLAMWSLSLDTQFYIICVVFLYVALNYKLDIKKCLAVLFILTYIVNMIIFYQEELPLFTWIDIKRIKRIDFYHDATLETGYVGFWINIGSSLVGILFGYFYFHHKEKVVTKTFERLCGPIFTIIPISAVLVATLKASKLISVFFGPLLKPLYGFGIASGIYGMSRNIIQGWPKSICENKYTVLLGNFTFATYVYHLFFVFNREAKNTFLIEVKLIEVGVSAVMDIVQSFALGIVCALVIEQPGINIKKMILPQIIRREESCQKQRNGYKDKDN